MKGKNFKTRYASIVKKGSKGVCVNELSNPLNALLIEFSNGEKFWFFLRDLEEVAE